MKSFAKFFTEAVETLASTEAKNRGLVGNGHGDWYDVQGNFVAKTINGKLKFFGQGDTISKDGIPGEEIKKVKKAKKTSNIKKYKEKEDSDNLGENGVVITVGRFNPPSKNHEDFLKSGYSEATRRNYEYRIYPSRIQDKLTNPLNPSNKIDYMRLIFPKYADYIVDSEESKTIFDILDSVYSEGYKNVIIVVGQERLGEFQALLNKSQYNFENIDVISSGTKDPDSNTEDPGSSALMRASVVINDFNKFQIGLPANLKMKIKEDLFKSLKKIMNVSESIEAWKISPELDENGLRWNYKENGLFEVGSYVENLNTGLVGEIIRKGTNYIICVTEDNIMFKSWLKDVREVYEIGTKEYLNHAQKITPGEIVKDGKNNSKQINKNRKRTIQKK